MTVNNARSGTLCTHIAMHCYGFLIEGYRTISYDCRMLRNRVFNSLWWVILIFAFVWPTSLELPWDGIPVNHRGELILLLLAALFFLRQFLLRINLSGANGSSEITTLVRSKRIIKVAIGGAAFFLLLIKFLTPPSEGIELKVRNPQFDSEFRHTSERFINKIEYGGPQIPWRMGFLNTTHYNFISCQLTDALCLARRKWKKNLSLPFEATFKIPRSWLNDPSKLNVQFLGSFEVLSENRLSRANYFSASPKQLSIQLQQNTGPIEVRYRNFDCQSGNFSECLNEKANPLSFSEATLQVETVPPPKLIAAKRVGRFLIVLLCSFLLALIGCEFIESTFPLKQITAIRIPKEWKATVGFCTALLVLMFFITFKKPLLKSHGAFLSVQLVGLVLCVYLSLFKRLVSLSHIQGINRQNLLRISIDALLTLPGLLYLFLVVRKMPSHDGFYLLNDGDDWLSYASVAYEFLERPSWFTDAHYVFTKPLFIYFRAFLYLLLGEGTTYIEILLRYGIALIPLLVLPVISDLLAEIQRRKWFIAIPVIAYCFFWCLKNFASYVLIFWVSMGEIPAWFFGLLACISLVYTALKILAGENYSFPIAASALFSLLSSVSRLQSIAVLILPWIAVASLSKKEGKRVLVTGLLCGVATLAVILGHAVPIFIKNFTGLVAYLGWTTQMKASDPLLTVLQSFWKKVTFAPQAKVLLLSLPVIGGLSLFFRRRVGGFAPYLFWLAFALSLVLHAFIRDAAYPPRHYVLLSQTTAYLTILFTLLLLIRQTSGKFGDQHGEV